MARYSCFRLEHGFDVRRIFQFESAECAPSSLVSPLPGDGRLEAELLVSSRAIGFIEPGDRVLLRYQAYPYQKFGHHLGEVARISRSALSPGARFGLCSTVRGNGSRSSQRQRMR